MARVERCGGVVRADQDVEAISRVISGHVEGSDTLASCVRTCLDVGIEKKRPLSLPQGNALLGEGHVKLDRKAGEATTSADVRRMVMRRQR
jgi:hypothetical protein